MHLYPFHLGDYTTHTAHLTALEDIAYRRLIDLYYLHEKPLSADPAELARQIRMREYAAEVKAVLDEFFALTDSGYRNNRCDAEIAKYHAMADGARKGAAVRWQKVREGESNAQGNPPPLPTLCPPNAQGNAPGNASPLPTKNQEPVTKNHVTPLTPQGEVDELFDELWAAYPRKVGKDAAKKAFEKRKPTRALVDAMLAAIAVQKQSLDWTKDGGQFIPHPTTWLNQGRWTDEAATPDHMAGWSDWARSQALKMFPDGNVPSWYKPMASPAGG